MRPEVYTTEYRLEPTGTTASNGSEVFSMIPVSGSDTTTYQVNYDAEAGGLFVGEMLYVKVG